ncbi:thiamine-phosphate kinase [Myxosarcina sp. GI1]|uniref:thiamine-phosphate kinase n=1 Tax=Myxosarcina sp. GI1 TaxID=1541065 RepID=UPI00056BFE74|nr:thiamine-phosphate kinase [Myxosarcina sp. GI1]
MTQLVKDIGEHGLLKKLQFFCPEGVVGDDGAILPFDADKSLVVTTDVLVDKVHFSDRTTAAYDVGWRSVTANLSDLAAMGATPIGITVGLALPGTVAVAWVEELYRGMHDCLSRDRTPIVGGDVCCSEVISLAITAFGRVVPNRAILRSNARPGDAIVITGLHGLSRGGLELLTNPEPDDRLSDSERSSLIEAHQRPVSRLDVLPFLEEISSDIAIGGMDSSDGLADAIEQICHYSQVGAKIKFNYLKIPSALVKLAGVETAWEWTLYGGEDFELVLTLTPSVASDLVEYLGGEAAIIGTVTENPQIIIDRDNAQLSGLNFTKKFKHF